MRKTVCIFILIAALIGACAGEAAEMQTALDFLRGADGIHAVWINADKMIYSLSLYDSGYCLISIEDTQASSDSLASRVGELERSNPEFSVADLIKAVTSYTKYVYSYAARFETDGKVLSIKLLDGDMSLTPETFFMPSWDGVTKTLSVEYSLDGKVLTLYNALGKTLAFTSAPLSGEAPNDERFWRYLPVAAGDRGDKVELLQSKLIEKGFLSGKADGIFGNKTRAAIEALQEKNGLEITGTADDKVWDILLDG